MSLLHGIQDLPFLFQYQWCSSGGARRKGWIGMMEMTEKKKIKKVVAWPPFFFYQICFDADVMTSPETVIFAGKAYLKMKLLVNAPLHEQTR